MCACVFSHSFALCLQVGLIVGDTYGILEGRRKVRPGYFFPSVPFLLGCYGLAMSIYL